MVGAVLYSNSVLHLPSFSGFSTPKLGKQLFSLKEISDRLSVSSIRADGNRRERPPQKKSSSGRAPKGEGLEDNPQSFDDKSSVSPNKEEILALFKRIQSSISKGETMNSKKRISKAADNKPTAESILEVLRLPRAQGKGKTLGKKGDKLVSPRKDSLQKEEITEHSPAMSLESTPLPSSITRRPSNFTRKSPIPSLSSPRDKVEPKSELLPATNGNSEMQSKKYEEMKLIQLKEVAKSKGIRGYSKLKKSELVELLIRS